MSQEFRVIQSVTKGELFAVEVNGKRVGNFRRTSNGYRQGVGEGAVFHSLELSIEDVAKIIAEGHASARQAKVDAKAKAKQEALDAKAERENTDGAAKPKAKAQRKPRRSKKQQQEEEVTVALPLGE